MTRQRMYILTAIAALIYIALGIVFADGFFTGTFWSSESLFGASYLSYLLLAVIVIAGIFQAQRLPAGGVDIEAGPATTTAGQVDDPTAWKLLLGNTYLAILWLPVRFFVGQEWLAAGEEKLRSDAWMNGGTALKGFWTHAVAVPQGAGKPPITYDWFRSFLQYMLNHEWYTWFAKLVAAGETLVGLGLIFGALVGIAAFFGTMLNFNFLLAGTTSTNPVLFGLTVFIVLGWKVAGYIGIDRWLLPALGTPWQPGRMTGGHRHRHRVGEQRDAV